MTYLGIDTTAAHALVGALRRGAAEIDDVQQLIIEAETLSDVASHSLLPLDHVSADWQRSAAEIAAALSIVEAFRIELTSEMAWLSAVPVPVPTRTPVPTPPLVDESRAGATVPALWNASPTTAWNEVHQDASHNSYAVPGGVGALFDLGVRTFELDIHRGPPGSVLRAVPLFDAQSSADVTDWRVFHVTGDSASEYEFLSDGLDAIAALETAEPLTIFIDNKDSFAGAHTAARFDRVLEASLGARLYRPADFASREPAAATMHAVIDAAGWPTVQELEGRVIVVLTDNVDNYETAGSAAFVAGRPNLVRTVEGLQHVPLSDRIFYNANHRQLDEEGIAAVHESGGTSRTYFNPRCLLTPFGVEPVLPNYRAVDIEPGLPSCGSRVVVPPVDTPVPEPNSD